MQFNVAGKNQSYLFGVDRTNGVFLSVLNAEGEPILNLSEFYPFDKRFNLSNWENVVNSNEIPEEDLKAILEKPIGEFSVFFEGIQCQEEEWHDGIEVPEAIQQYVDKVINGVNDDEPLGLQVKCLKDYLDFIMNFKDHEVLTFDEVSWVNDSTLNIDYTIYNDQTSN